LFSKIIVLKIYQKTSSDNHPKILKIFLKHQFENELNVFNKEKIV